MLSKGYHPVNGKSVPLAHFGKRRIQERRPKVEIRCALAHGAIQFVRNKAAYETFWFRASGPTDA